MFIFLSATHFNLNLPSFANLYKPFAFQNTIDEWSIIFIIAAVAYIVPAVIFVLFGSGQVQPWNESKKADDKMPEAE